MQVGIARPDALQRRRNIAGLHLHDRPHRLRNLQPVQPLCEVGHATRTQRIAPYIVHRRILKVGHPRRPDQLRHAHARRIGRLPALLVAAVAARAVRIKQHLPPLRSRHIQRPFAEPVHPLRRLRRKDRNRQLIHHLLVPRQPGLELMQVSPAPDLVPEKVRVDRIARDNRTVAQPAVLVLRVPEDRRLAVGHLSRQRRHPRRPLQRTVFGGVSILRATREAQRHLRQGGIQPQHLGLLRAHRT